MKTLTLTCCLITAASLFPAPLSAATKESSSLELVRSLNQAFIEVAEKVSPSVVYIRVSQKQGRMFTSGEEGNPLFEMLPREFRKQLEEQFERRRRNRGEKEGEAEPHFNGQGSGVILREDGYILTNRHVVEEADKIKVRLQDGTEFDATVRGMDPQSDLAVLKVDPKGKKLVAAKFADSNKTRVGEFAIAIGAPFGLDYSVTVGHVSAKGRSQIIPDPSMDQDFIQTDANINPGNSGGPLVNINSEIIGINTLIRGIGTGIGFAVPSSLARDISEKLIADGKVIRAWLGVSVQPFRENTELRNLFPNVKDGIIVSSIMPTGPAAKSELKASDIITHVEGTPVRNALELRAAVRAKKVGETLTLDVVRAGKNIKVKVKTDVWPEAEAETRLAKDSTTNGEKRLGITVKPITKKLAEEFSLKQTTGLVITEVERGSGAERRGIKPGDVITEVNQKPVKSLEEYRDALKSADTKKGVIVNLLSEGVSKFEVLKSTD